MKELDQNTVSTIDLGKKRKKKEGRHEFQQFKTKETERTKEEGGNVHRRKKIPHQTRRICLQWTKEG